MSAVEPSAPEKEGLGETVGLWKTLNERALEIGDVERKSWTASSYTESPAKPDELSAIRFPGLSPMAKKLSRARSVRTIGNIGPSELTQWYHAQPSSHKHTPDEWRASQAHLQNIASVRSTASEKSRRMASTNRIGGQQHLDIKQTQVQEAFQKRVGDLELYHNRLQECLSNINKTISGLQASLEDMQAFMNSRFGWPGQVNTVCLEFRNERLGIENVSDLPEHSLIAEGEMLETVKEESFNVLETEAKESLEMMKAFGCLLAADIERKRKAISVDQKMESMSLIDKGLMLHLPDIQRAPGDSVMTSEWIEAVEKLLKDSVEAQQSAGELRERMSQSAKHSDMLVKQHEDEVNEQFKVHLLELKNAQELTAGLLKENKQNIGDTVEEIASLKERLDAQLDPLKRTTTRLHGRRERVDVERTRDIVHTSLIQEVAELDGVCSNLTEELENMQDELEELRQVEGMLEEDLAMKTKSIQIDEKCMKLRSMLGDDADPQRVKMMQRGGPWIAWGLRWA